MSDETRALWTAVDEYANSHTHPGSRANTEALRQAGSVAREAGLPDIAASAAQAKFLALFCRAAGVTHALELGTLGGNTAIWLASENPQLRLTTVEREPAHAEVARRNIEAAGLSDRIEVILGEGVDVVAQLRQDVVESRRPRFGFFFIDADKENNTNYYEAAVDMAAPRAVICVDNVVRQGRIVDSSDLDPRVEGSRRVIEKAGKDPRVDSVVLQTVGDKGHDGWLWAVVA